MNCKWINHLLPWTAQNCQKVNEAMRRLERDSIRARKGDWKILAAMIALFACFLLMSLVW